MIRRSFVLGTAGLVLLPTQGFGADTVSGRFVANGKDIKLAFVSVWPRDPFSGKEAIVIVMTEKDHAASKKPDFDADFGKFGGALSMSLLKADGKIFGTQITHPGLKRGSVSASGIIKGEGVKITGNRVEGHFKTEGQETIFRETFELDVQVAADIRQRPA